jgi:response regulator RpfG family c-di-GMP phosphodiesterase
MGWLQEELAKQTRQGNVVDPKWNAGGMPRLTKSLPTHATPQKLLDCGLLIAKSPEEGLAISISKENHAGIRLVITDVVMPAMNGRQLAEQILKISPNTSPNTKILYISGCINNAIAHYGALEEGIWFPPKPFTLSALVSKVREVLDSCVEGERGE